MIASKSLALRSVVPWGAPKPVAARANTVAKEKNSEKCMVDAASGDCPGRTRWMDGWMGAETFDKLKGGRGGKLSWRYERSGAWTHIYRLPCGPAVDTSGFYENLTRRCRSIDDRTMA